MFHNNLIITITLLSLTLLLCLVWLVPYLRKRRRNRPINLPPRQTTDSIRMALAIDVDTSTLTMPQENERQGQAKYLLLDTETYNPILSNDDAEEYAFSEPIALSWQILDERGTRISEFSTLIQQKQEEDISHEATEIHGITQDMMLHLGISPETAYAELFDALKQCEFIVAHNLNFHRSTLCQDMQRYGLDETISLINNKIGMCTMEWGKSLGFKTWGGGEPLYPRLDELFGHLYFGRMHLPLSYKSKTLRDVRLLSACLRYKLNHTSKS